MTTSYLIRLVADSAAAPIPRADWSALSEFLGVAALVTLSVTATALLIAGVIRLAVEGSGDRS